VSFEKIKVVEEVVETQEEKKKIDWNKVKLFSWTRKFNFPIGNSILPSQQEEVQNRPSDQSQNEGNTRIARKKEASGRSKSEKLEKGKDFDIFEMPC